MGTDLNGVAGTDGIVPIYQPDARWAIWAMSEIYFGGPALGKFVPKVKDYVMDIDMYTMYIVTYLDPVTLIPTLQKKNPGNMDLTLSETDILFGVGPGTQADTYRAYVDRSVIPYVLAVDARLRVAGSMCSYAKIFKGSDLDGTGLVISKMYDNNGQFVSENVPLELVAIDSHVNYSIKTVAVCHTTEKLNDGEVVTVVMYTDQGHVVSKRQLLIENTSFIRSVNSSLKYVSHISLNCPFMSPTLDNTIQFPLNIPVNGLNLTGTVHYSDGSTMTLPVDGNKFRMLGLDQYVSTIVGQKIKLVLSYALSPNEVAYASVGTEARYVTEAYELITINPNNSYAVKLFGYPFWIDSANGYQMRWWLFNLDRNITFEVTPYVKFSEETGAFDPKGYGYLQRKSVSVNLRDVSGSFKPFVHTQVVDIILLSSADNVHDAWQISNESANNHVMFGTGLKALIVDSASVNLSSGINNLNTWLEKLYKNTYPLINPSTESEPVTPTHFVITYNGTVSEFPISDWNQPLNIGVNIEEFKTLTVRFIKRAVSNNIQLSIAALMIKSI